MAVVDTVVVDTVAEAIQAAIMAEGTQGAVMAEATQAVIMAVEDTQVVIMATGHIRAAIIMATEDTRAAITMAVATIIMTVGMAGGTVTTLIPGELLSMVIRAGGRLIRMPIPIIVIRTGILTRAPIRLSIHIILPRRRSLNSLPHSTRDSSPTTGTTARIRKVTTRTLTTVLAVGYR